MCNKETITEEEVMDQILKISEQLYNIDDFWEHKTPEDIECPFCETKIDLPGELEEKKIDMDEMNHKIKVGDREDHSFHCKNKSILIGWSPMGYVTYRGNKKIQDLEGKGSVEWQSFQYPRLEEHREENRQSKGLNKYE